MKLMAKSFLAILPLAALLFGCSRLEANKPAEGSVEWKIALARSAGPAALTEKATVLDFDGTVLKEGSNGWTCTPGMSPEQPYPMCNDEVWMKAMQALMTKSEFSTDRIGVSYMLQGDSNVSNSDPYATDPNNGDVWVQEGPHLMILVPKAQLEGLSDDPTNGGPYVMWKDTPYAHIMVPVNR